MLNTPLQNIMTKGYLYVEEHEFTGKALSVMRDMHISCVFVLKRDRPVGILTERSIMEQSVKGRDIFITPIAEIISSPLQTLHVNDTVEKACQFMTEKQLRHIGVFDNDRDLKGTITPSNIVNILGSESFSSVARIGEVMYTNLAVSRPDSTLREGAINILENNTCCTIVMEGDYPSGIVSEKDIVRCLTYGQSLDSLTLDKVMSSPPISIQESDTIAEAIVTLHRHRIHRILVYNNEGRVSGILANNSLVRNIKKIVQ